MGSKEILENVFAACGMPRHLVRLRMYAEGWAGICASVRLIDRAGHYPRTASLSMYSAQHLHHQ